ncbi:MAG: tetratricopeptide repeat protein, partial [Thiotrichaceae bacterium]|nr:tetratricopeptide repeat protein [Thiotrichaceae bacterium]
LLTKLAEEYQGAFILAKVNADEQQEIVAQAGVKNLPTIKLFIDGAVVDEFSGAKTESEIRLFLENHISNESDNEIDKALALSAAGEFEQAIDALKVLNQADPSNSKIYLAIAKVYLLAKDFDNCDAVLKALPANIQTADEAQKIIDELNLARATSDAPAVEELLSQLETEPENHTLRLQLANQYIVARQYEAALESLMSILMQDINAQEGEAKAAMLKIFELLGAQEPLTRLYRSKLATLLY